MATFDDLVNSVYERGLPGKHVRSEALVALRLVAAHPAGIIATRRSGCWEPSVGRRICDGTTQEREPDCAKVRLDSHSPTDSAIRSLGSRRGADYHVLRGAGRMLPVIRFRRAVASAA